jgi:hypothetical protein
MSHKPNQRLQEAKPIIKNQPAILHESEQEQNNDNCCNDIASNFYYFSNKFLRFSPFISPISKLLKFISDELAQIFGVDPQIIYCILLKNSL